MKKIITLFVITLAMLLALPARSNADNKDSLPVIGSPGAKMNFTVQTRDSSTNKINVTRETVDSRKVAVIIVDPWNFHWCMTAAERVGAMVARWNEATAGARKLGMTIMWAPSDIAGNYAGYHQREKAFGVKLIPVPEARELPHANFTAPGGMCMCGPGIACEPNFGWDAMNPDLHMADEDLIVSSTDEAYSICKERGITHIVYMGLHTNVCLYGKPAAMKFMYQAGLKCMLARDINDAITIYDPQKGYTPDDGTRQTDEDIERAGIGTVNVLEEWKKAGVWNSDLIVETVRITPWGRKTRPYFFEATTIVTLTTPHLKDAEIRYTLDGSEPTTGSVLYTRPIELAGTTAIRTAAFLKGKKISIPTEGYFVRLQAEPPKPDVYLDVLKPVIDPYAALGEVYALYLLDPRVGQSYAGKPLQIREKEYKKGLGFQAPSGVRYPLKPEYKRFVGKAGIADNMIKEDMGRNKAVHCSVVFLIYVDGILLSESPVMRISQEPWRFNIKIPDDGRYIRIACMDAGSRSAYDLGNLVDAGFVLN